MWIGRKMPSIFTKIKKKFGKSGKEKVSKSAEIVITKQPKPQNPKTPRVELRVRNNQKMREKSVRMNFARVLLQSLKALTSVKGRDWARLIQCYVAKPVGWHLNHVYIDA